MKRIIKCGTVKSRRIRKAAGEKLVDVHGKLMGLIQRAPYIRCEDVHRQYAVNWLMNNGVTVQEWTSVKDRLPEQYQKVLCFNYNGEHEVLRWNYIDWMWNSGIEWHKEDYVLFWMPLPQPPKGE